MLIMYGYFHDSDIHNIYYIYIYNKRGGGVSIFIKNNIKYKLIDNLSLYVNDAYDMVTISFIYIRTH